MAQQLNVDINVMRSALTKYTEGAANARALQSSVQSLSGSISGVWAGAASNSYQATINDWSTQANRVIAALEGLRDSLQGSMTRLAQAEQDARQFSQT